MMATGIGATMLGLATLTMVNLYKDFSAATAYRDVHEDARRSLAFLSKDLRSASNITLFSSSNITFNALDSTGGVVSVRYQLVNQNLQRTYSNSVANITTNLLTDNVTTVQFERWTKPGTVATTVDNTYEIRASITVTNTSSFRVASDLLQTRIRLRNR